MCWYMCVSNFIIIKIKIEYDASAHAPFVCVLLTSSRVARVSN